MNDAWMGLESQMSSYLEVVGADKDPITQRFYVVGTIIRGMGGDELIIGKDAVYFHNGKARPLAAAMNCTSYGLRNVTVIT